LDNFTDGPSDGWAVTRGPGVDYGARGVGTVTTVDPGSPARRRATDGQGRPCVYRSRRIDTALEALRVHAPLIPEHLDPATAMLYLLWCNEEFLGPRWLQPGEVPDPAVDAAVETLLDRLAVAPTRIEARPPTAGLVGLPAHVWVPGVPPGPRTGSLTLAATGTTVAVAVELARVVWTFGDGTPARTADLGRPWPEPSTVQHVYARPSPAATPFTVTARLLFEPSYTVDGFPGLPLDPFEVEVTVPYAVREVQAVRDR
jgi:hypothetical protein